MDVDGIHYSLEVSGRFKYIAYGKSDYPVVGDYVYFRETNNLEGIIESVEERTSALKRLGVTQTSEAQVIASNIDIVFLCFSMNQDFKIRKVRNFLSLTYSTEFETIILLTKSDLTDNIDYYLNEIAMIADHTTLPVSIFNQEDLEMLKEITQDKTCVFVGSSGVGKSTLINGMLGEKHFETKDVRVSDDQGRHTTAHRELVQLDNGGSIIDTPGIRIVQSYIVDDLDVHFEDIKELSDQCKFRDCTHTNEPGCKVTEAIDANELDYERYLQYLKAKKLNAYNLRKERIKEKLQNKQTKKRL